jgi:hypothetical protein
MLAWRERWRWYAVQHERHLCVGGESESAEPFGEGIGSGVAVSPPAVRAGADDVHAIDDDALHGNKVAVTVALREDRHVPTLRLEQEHDAQG